MYIVTNVALERRAAKGRAGEGGKGGCGAKAGFPARSRGVSRATIARRDRGRDEGGEMSDARKDSARRERVVASRGGVTHRPADFFFFGFATLSGLPRFGFASAPPPPPLRGDSSSSPLPAEGQTTGTDRAQESSKRRERAPCEVSVRGAKGGGGAAPSAQGGGATRSATTAGVGRFQSEGAEPEKEE